VSNPQRTRRFIADYAWVASGELISKVAGFLAFAYLARLLAPEAYGSVELAVAVAMVGYLVVDFGLGPVAARAVTRTPEQSSALTGSVPAIRTALSLGVVAVAGALGHWIGRNEEERILILFFATSLLAAPWVMDWLFQGLDRVKWVAPAQMLRMGLFLGGVAIFVEGPEHLLRVGIIEIAAFAAMSAYYVIAARVNNERPRLKPDSDTLRTLAREATPVGLGQLLWALNQYLPTLALAAGTAGVEVAYYGASHRVVFSLSSFVFLYFFTLYPLLVRATSGPPQDFEELTSHSLRVTAWLGILIALMGTALAEPICRLAFGDAFGESAAVLALVVWALPINLISGHARFALIAAGHQTAQMWAQAVGVALTLALCVVLVPTHQSMGAAYALIASALGVWAVAHIATLRLVAPMAGLTPLWKPACTALGVWTVAEWLPLGPGTGSALFVGAAYLALALVLERSTLGELVRRLGSGPPEDNP